MNCPKNCGGVAKVIGVFDDRRGMRCQNRDCRHEFFVLDKKVNT